MGVFCWWFVMISLLVSFPNMYARFEPQPLPALSRAVRRSWLSKTLGLCRYIVYDLKIAWMLALVGAPCAKNLLLFPAVSSHTNVITLSASSIGYCSFLLDEALSSKYLILGKIHLHFAFKIHACALWVVIMENGILWINVDFNDSPIRIDQVVVSCSRRTLLIILQ